MLVDVDNNDGGINGRGGRRAVAETGVERIVLEALQEGEDRSSTFAEECEVVQRESQKRDDQADQKRDAVLPPRFEDFEERKCEAREPIFF